MNKVIVEQKQQVVQEIRDKISNAKSVVLVDYRGLNVDEVSELRRKYSEAGVEYKVYKNTMMRFAFKEEGFEEFTSYLKGPSAIAISTEDPVIAARVTNDFAKEHKKLELKAGIVEGDVLNLEKITAIANLPSKEQLLTQLVVGLNAPIGKFARTIQAIVDKQEGGNEAASE
ncbi:50S ribosomal protein L10 [Clostridium sp. D2Q-11]|uniref:Large ribosomal subunit protein uL10 n=1 Tax=Anaeromonas frigoriresistens TaxID=2683708 RepID=A0A942V0W9_9FIRM|nr:50S ribosomal protein L10 [Anaeromonas frigoriresistens]MBS4538007.1 50S ribosomal protein L10 [Anaeromonas frigoriresistens]